MILAVDPCAFYCHTPCIDSDAWSLNCVYLYLTHFIASAINFSRSLDLDHLSAQGGGPRVVVSTAAFHARVRGSVPGLGGLKETKLFLPHPRVKVSIVGSLRDREVACSASDRQGSNFESCVWRTVSSQSSHHPQEVLLAQFSLYVHKGGLKPDSFHFITWVPLTLKPPNYSIWIFTHLKLCLANAIHNFKWVKIIQIWQNWGQLFSNIADWCHILSSTSWKCGT